MIGSITRREPWVPVLATLALLGSLALSADRLEAQGADATAFGTYVNALGVTAQSPVATLDSAGYSLADADRFSVEDAVDARWLTAVTTGAADEDEAVSSSQSISTLEDVDILDGLIRADAITAVASSYRDQETAGSDAEGSAFVNLVVSGDAVATHVPPNTRVDLPGIGYAVLNEQERAGDGVATSGISVNMVRVVLQDALTGIQTGEIVVGSAQSDVQ